jgi:hypothetical protein
MPDQGSGVSERDAVKAEDTDWLTFETVKFRINPALSAEQREALRMDYGLAVGDLGTPRASVDETLSASRDVHRSRKPSGSSAALCVNGVKRQPRAGPGVSTASFAITIIDIAKRRRILLIADVSWNAIGRKLSKGSTMERRC